MANVRDVSPQKLLQSPGRFGAWLAGDLLRGATQRDGGDVLAGVVTFSVCGRGTKDYNLRVLTRVF